VALVLREQPKRLLQWFGWHLVVTVAFLPQMPVFLHQLTLSSDHWMKKPTVEDLENLSRKVAFGAYYAVPLVALIAVLPLFRREHRRTAAMVWWVMVAPAAVAFALTYRGYANLFVERYMYFIVPLFCALIAEGLVGTHFRRLGTIAAVLMIAFAARQVLIKRPYTEAVSLDGIVRGFERSIRPGDVVFCADSHSLFVVENRNPTADAKLLMTWPRLPYYEGAAFIPDSMRTSLEDLGRTAREGRRWWGVRTRHGGMSSAAGAAAMDSLARGGKREKEMVTLWAGQPGMMSDSPGGTAHPASR
jgi:hypothetical protein